MIMNLSKLFNGVKCKSPLPSVEITSICTDSRVAESGCAFFCMNGKNHSSAYHAGEAVEKGAAVIVSEKSLDFDRNIVVDDIELALSICCDNFYSNPSEKLKIAGITGTNGKTTVSFMVKHIVEFCSEKSGLMGTVGNFAGENFLGNSGFTTPDPVKLYAIFNSFVKENAHICVMEVSSQALSQGRCKGLHFNTAVFTNLTQEHLDYHGSMESYAKAKSLLFQNADNAVLNLDDKYYSRFSGICQNEMTYSVKNSGADFFAKNIVFSKNHTAYYLVFDDKKYSVRMNITGLYNVSNSLAAIGCCVMMGFPVDRCVSALLTFQGVKGRAEVLKTDTPFTVMIDYAHTPDAILNLFSAVKATTIGKVIALFGCGGERDRAKRSVMGRICAENADFLVVTSDNPRSENPYKIIHEILKGVENTETPFAVIEDRKKAIEFSLSIAGEGDTVILCGKGHEDYQITSQGKIHFDEREIVYNSIKMNNYLK